MRPTSEIRIEYVESFPSWRGSQSAPSAALSHDVHTKAYPVGDPDHSPVVAESADPAYRSPSILGAANICGKDLGSTDVVVVCAAVVVDAVVVEVHVVEVVVLVCAVVEVVVDGSVVVVGGNNVVVVVGGSVLVVDTVVVLEPGTVVVGGSEVVVVGSGTEGVVVDVSAGGATGSGTHAPTTETSAAATKTRRVRRISPLPHLPPSSTISDAPEQGNARAGSPAPLVECRSRERRGPRLVRSRLRHRRESSSWTVDAAQRVRVEVLPGESRRRRTVSSSPNPCCGGLRDADRPLTTLRVKWPRVVSRW